MAEHLLTEIKDGVGLLFNRPERLNAVSPEMVEAFIAATLQLERDDSVRCVLIRSADEVFMSGSDVKNFKRSLTEDRDAHLAGMERRVVNGQLTIHRLRRMAKPVIVPKEKLEEEALALATQLAQGPTLALGGIKRLIRASHESSWDEQLAREAESIAEVVGTDDHLEGVTAFLEKRPPRFTGR